MILTAPVLRSAASLVGLCACRMIQNSHLCLCSRGKHCGFTPSGWAPDTTLYQYTALITLFKGSISRTEIKLQALQHESINYSLASSQDAVLAAESTMKTASGILLLLTFLNLCIYTSVSGQIIGEKRSRCPLELDGLPCTTANQASLCSSDSNCTGDEKCCKYHCKFQCVKPVQDKNGICPDWDASTCLYVRPAPGYCQNDTQCPGKQRCCCYGCKRQCVTPEVKPGMCPVQCSPSSSNKECDSDEECFGNQKCCGETCQDPEPVHPGFCPTDPRRDDQCPPEIPLAPLCRSDSECQSNEKCCFFGCRRQCVKTLAVKPGMCPAILAKCSLPLPPSKCFSDNGCPGTQKCCALCGNVCMTPDTEHDGVCPPHLGAPQPCRYNSSVHSCTHDWHCATNQKCCFSGYMKQCVTSLAERPGLCRTIKQVVKEDKKKECPDKCKSDRDCPENEKCCLGTKGYECLISAASSH